MTQNAFPVIDPNADTGTSLAGYLNNWSPAVVSSHAGPARPGYAVAGTIWYDTDVSKPFFFNGSLDKAFMISDDLAGLMPIAGGNFTGPIGGTTSAFNTLTLGGALIAGTALTVRGTSNFVGTVGVTGVVAATSTISTDGGMTCKSFAVDTGEAATNIFTNGGASFILWGSTSSLSFGRTDGSLSFTFANILRFQYRSTDSLLYNAIGPVGGHGAFIDLSDRRAKRDIADCEYGLAEVLLLKPSRFTMIDTDKTSVGFIAQDVLEVIPEAVSFIPGVGSVVPAEGEPEVMGLSDRAIVAALVKAVQQLNIKIEAQAAEIATLKGTQA